MHRSLAIATLIASSVLTVEAATIPAHAQRAPAAREQVFRANGTAAQQPDRSQMKRRLVRRRTNHSKRGGDHCQPIASTTSDDTDSSKPSKTTTSSGKPPKSTSDWQHVETIQGDEFFNAWNWWEWDDPTHGYVQYVPQAQAEAEGLAFINDKGNAIMKVEDTPHVDRPRKSVRVHGKRVWNGGMVILDVVHMPIGCGTWPAWWMNGPDWPNGGEIDIIEGVNMYAQNQVSLHTGPGCTMPRNLNDGMTGTLLESNSFDAFDCATPHTNNQGCGVRDPTTTSYGEGLNRVGGGVSVLIWAKAGITAYWFTRDNIPEDITEGSPTPDNWGKPLAHFPSDNCNMYEAFHDHFNIFDTTLCGDWAGNTWHAPGPGEGESCAQRTGVGSCIEYIQQNGNAMKNAYWEVKNIVYYNSTTLV